MWATTYYYHIKYDHLKHKQHPQIIAQNTCENILKPDFASLQSLILDLVRFLKKFCRFSNVFSSETAENKTLVDHRTEITMMPI